MDTDKKNWKTEIAPELLVALQAESDRGVVLVVASMVERELEKHLELRLLPKLDRTDELMSQSAVSPIATFSAKINLAYRVGAITESERDVFHQLRSIRNRCAHEIDSQTFDTNHFRDRIKNMVTAAPVLWDAMRSHIKPSPFDSHHFESVEEYLDAVGWRPLFELFFAMIVAHKQVSYDRVSRIKALSDGG